MKRNILAGLLAALMLLSLTACGGSAVNGSGATMDAAMVETSSSSSASASGAADYGTAYEEMESEDSKESGEVTDRKFIITAHLELETTNFEEAVRGLTALTGEFGGYFENSSIANRKSGARWADYSVRVPAERYEAFLNQAGSLCHETWREATQDDITERYYDTAGRLKTQQIKLERLQALLAQAEAMEDIITIESAISETEWMIDDLSGTLRHYDSKVNYATVYISLHEVYKLSNVEAVPESFGERLGVSFMDGLSDFADTLENLAVAFAYSWMWWLLAAVAVALVASLLRRKRLEGKKPPFWKRGRKKTDDKSE